MKLLAIMGGLMAMATPSAGAAAEPAKPVEVMVLGTYHFDNPGLDLHNVKAEDVTTPKRQAELAALARALAEFRPTRIMVERVVAAPDLVDPEFAAFTPAALKSERSERVQIGYRLAYELKLGRVYGIDEQHDFPFGKVSEFAKAKGMQARIDALMAKSAAAARDIEEKQTTHSIAELLIDQNDPAGPASSIDIYYELLGIGDTEQQPGAHLNAMWYLRNAKIFAKLMTVAEPGDRILVVYGSGHNYWLRHFAANVPGFRNVDPVPYLRKAAGKQEPAALSR